MLVTTIEQQILIGRAARAAGGYDKLAEKVAKARAEKAKRKASEGK